MSYQFIMPKQVFYGENALSDASEHISAFGKKALLVATAYFTKNYLL